MCIFSLQLLYMELIGLNYTLTNMLIIFYHGDLHFVHLISVEFYFALQLLIKLIIFARLNFKFLQTDYFQILLIYFWLSLFQFNYEFVYYPLINTLLSHNSINLGSMLQSNIINQVLQIIDCHRNRFVVFLVFLFQFVEFLNCWDRGVGHWLTLLLINF